MNTTTNVPHSTPVRTVGQQAYLIGRYSNVLVTVTKITPTGRIYVGNKERMGDAVAVFLPYTDYTGLHAEYAPSNIFAHDNRRLNFDVAGVEADAARKERTKEAIVALQRVVAPIHPHSNASKAELMEAMERLEAHCKLARAAVEAI